LSSQGGEDVDIYGVCVAGENGAVTVFVMRRGQVLDRREYFFEGQEALSERRLLSELLPQIYDRTSFVPREIQLPMAIDDSRVLADWLSEKKGRRVSIRVPVRGSKANRVRFAMRNAKMSFRRRFRLDAEQMAGSDALRVHLHLEDSPRRIEGFDISTHHGAETVASLVVWEGGEMRKRFYRSFNIRGLDKADDFFSMQQVVGRAYKSRLEEAGEMPDVILIDGGRGQLNAAMKALSELGVEETPIVGLAKREEELYLPDHPEPLVLDRRDPGLQLLQKVRDEAHRFAITRHRRRRSKRMLSTKFDELIGVGSRRRQLLVRRFKSFSGLERASRSEIQSVLGVKVGSGIYDQLHRS
jgi:excinuclease ABC subunit C